MPLVNRISILLLLFVSTGLVRAENWPCWRGPRLDGSSIETKIPRSWNSGSNVAWKTELPGTGHASPIVWDDRIFTVSAVASDEARVLLSLDRQRGKLLWQKTVISSPMERKHSL